MGKAIEVPVKPSVLQWALRESGYPPSALAKRLHVPLSTVDAWERGEGHKPTLTQFRRLAQVLKRTPATLLLPRPPASSARDVKLRHAPGVDRDSLNHEERRFIREAGRVQDTVAWIMKELDEGPPDIPELAVGSDIERTASSVRTRLLSHLTRPVAEWDSSAEAFREWRAALERLGILVFILQLGKGSCRGFSLWNDRAPLIAVNSAPNYEARIFTLFHEYAHLLTRTSSACLEGGRGKKFSAPTDPAERWCERLAAAILLPWNEVRAFVPQGGNVRDLSIPKIIASRFKVSLRAATLRLIERGAADWSLYSEIPAYADDKRPGGGGKGRTRGEAKENQWGDRTVNLFVTALDRDVVNRADVLDYLDVTNADLDRLQRTGAGSE